MSEIINDGSGTPGGGIPIFTLPTGYAPPAPTNFPVVSVEAFGFITVEPNGDINGSTVGNYWVELDGVSFRV